jgi:hypothetical protein
LKAAVSTTYRVQSGWVFPVSSNWERIESQAKEEVLRRRDELAQQQLGKELKGGAALGSLTGSARVCMQQLGKELKNLDFISPRTRVSNAGS